MEIRTFWSFNSYSCNKPKTGQLSWKHDLWYLCFRLITTVRVETSKSPYLHEFSAEVSEHVFSAFLTILRLFTTLSALTQKISYLLEFSAQISQMVFSAHLTVSRLILTSMSCNFRTLISPWVQCTKTTNRVLSSFDRFAAYYNCMS